MLVQRLFYRINHIQCALRRHGLRDERRLPRAHATHGSGAVDWAMGLGVSSWIWVIIYDQTLFASAEAGTRELSIYIGIVCTILALVPAVFVKSKSTLDDTNLTPINAQNIGNSVVNIFVAFKDAYLNKPFRKLCIATFLIFNSFQTIAAFSFFIIVHYLFAGDAGAAGVWPTLHGSVGALITTFIVIPTITRMSEHLR